MGRYREKRDGRDALLKGAGGETRGVGGIARLAGGVAGSGPGGTRVRDPATGKAKAKASSYGAALWRSILRGPGAAAALGDPRAAVGGGEASPRGSSAQGWEQVGSVQQGRAAHTK